MPRSKKQPAPIVEISVVIPTYERPTLAAATAVAATQQGATEVVVIDQSCDDSHEELLDGLPKTVRVIRMETPSLSKARKIGLSSTTEQIILFLDDDVILNPGCLLGHLDAMTQAKMGAMVGRIRELRLKPNSSKLCNEIDRFGRVWSSLDHDEFGVVQVLKGANMSLRREACSALEFDPNYLGTAFLEDADISEQIRKSGWEIGYAPNGSLVHLSAPRGGCRCDTAQEAERWRFHNTAYFLSKHRGSDAYWLAKSAFAALAVKHAVNWSDMSAFSTLTAAFDEGWALAQG